MQNVQDVSKQAGQAGRTVLPKTDVRYWQGVLFHSSYTRGGHAHQVADWAVKIQHQGRRETFSLGTANKAAAASKAKEIYLNLQGAGWEKTLALHKPGKNEMPKGCKVATVGEFIAAAQATGCVRDTTFRGYAAALRKITADVHKIDGGRAKYDYVGDGHQKWLGQINSIPLSALTPESVQQWKLDFIRAAGQSPLKQKEARNSANAFLRNARSLFSTKLLKFVRVTLPEPLPFAGVQFEPRGSTRYRSEIDASKLVEAARDELATVHPEQYKIFLLGIMVGLRRSEIDLLEWSSLDCEQHRIRVAETDHFRPKNIESAGDVEIDPELVEILMAYQKTALGKFIVHSQNPPRSEATYQYYRCQNEFDKLVKWLRSKGVRARKPLHEMRKEFGSLLCARGGIYEASRALRHADIRTTSAHYLDKKHRVTVGLGGLLKPTV